MRRRFLPPTSRAKAKTSRMSRPPPVTIATTSPFTALRISVTSPPGDAQFPRTKLSSFIRSLHILMKNEMAYDGGLFCRRDALGLAQTLSAQIAGAVGNECCNEFGIVGAAERPRAFEPEIMPVHHSKERHRHRLEHLRSLELRCNSANRVGKNPDQLALHALKFCLSFRG